MIFVYFDIIFNSFIGNLWIIISSVFALVEIIPLPHFIKSIIKMPIAVKVQIGNMIDLRIAHVILVINLVVAWILKETSRQYEYSPETETPVLKNMRLSKKMATWSVSNFILILI